MASQRNFLDDEDGNSGQSTSLESGLIGGGAPAPQAGGAAQGSGWTNLQQYIDTNKGAGGAMADKALDGTTTEIGKTNDTVNAWAKSAEERTKAATKQDTWSDKITGKSADEINQTFANPDAFNAWKGLSGYLGPADATGDTGYGATAAASKNTQDKIDNANTYEGQQGLMKDAFSKDNTRYNSGFGALDTFVARADAPEKFTAFQDTNKGFSDGMTKASTGINTGIAGAKVTGAANHKSAMDAISGRIAGLNQDATTRADGQNAATLAAANTSRNTLHGAYNPAFANDTDVSPYITNAAGSDVMTAAERQAINSLAGMDDDESTGNVAAATTPGGFDWQKYQNDVSGKFGAWSDAQPVATTPAAPLPPTPEQPQNPTSIKRNIPKQVSSYTDDRGRITYNTTSVTNEDGSVDVFDERGNKLN